MKFYLPLAIAFLQFCCAPVYVSHDIAPKRMMNRQERKVYHHSQDFIHDCIQGRGPVKLAPKTAIDSVIVAKSEKLIRIYANQFLAYIPFRSKNVNLIYAALGKSLGFKYRKYQVVLYSLNKPIEQLIPNYYRESPANYDPKRLPSAEQIRPESVVRNIVNPGNQPRDYRDATSLSGIVTAGIITTNKSTGNGSDRDCSKPLKTFSRHLL